MAGSAVHFEEFLRHAGLGVSFGSLGTSAVYTVQPAGEIPARWVLLVHGLCEHPARFFPLARFLARRGCRVVLPTLAGHGHDPGSFARFRPLIEAAFREDEAEPLADFYRRKQAEYRPNIFSRHRECLRVQHRLSMSDHLAALQELTEQGKAIQGEEPRGLIGHSLGGLLACGLGRKLAVHAGQGPASVTLINPAMRPIGRPGAEARAVDFSWRHRRSVLFREGGCVQTAARWVRQTLDVAWSSEGVSDRPEQVALHQADPLNLRRVSGAYLLAIQSWMAELDVDESAYPRPVFLSASGRDRIVNGEGARRFGERLLQQADPGHRVFFFDEAFAHDLSRSTLWPRVEPTWAAWLGQFGL